MVTYFQFAFRFAHLFVLTCTYAAAKNSLRASLPSVKMQLHASLSSEASTAWLTCGILTIAHTQPMSMNTIVISQKGPVVGGAAWHT